VLEPVVGVQIGIEEPFDGLAQGRVVAAGFVEVGCPGSGVEIDHLIEEVLGVQPPFGRERPYHNRGEF